MSSTGKTDNGVRRINQGSIKAPEKGATTSNKSEAATKARRNVRDSFGKAAMAMMALPRYRHQTIADLEHLVLKPLIKNRIAIAYPDGDELTRQGEMLGMTIWASVSAEVDEKIREQIRAGGFPVRLKEDEWVSGEINWLLDVIAPDQKTTSSLIANIGKLVDVNELRVHPVITSLLDADTLQELGIAEVKPTDKSPD